MNPHPLRLLATLCLFAALTCKAAAQVLPVPASTDNLPEAEQTALPAPAAGIAVTLNGQSLQIEVERPENPLLVLSTTRGDILLELLPDAAPGTVANFLGLAEGTKAFIDPYTGQQSQRPFYDGLIFHRSIDGFMIQGGSPTGNGDGTPGYTFANEINATSLGLDRMLVVDTEGYPNPVLGIRSQQDFQQQVLLPLYREMGIDSQETLDARVDAVDQRVRSMTVQQHLEMLGYRFTANLLSRAPVRGVIAMANSGPDSNGSQFFITLADAQWLTGRYTVFGKVRAGQEVADAIGKVRVNADNRPLQEITILSLRRLNPDAVALPAAPSRRFE